MLCIMPAFATHFDTSLKVHHDNSFIFSPLKKVHINPTFIHVEKRTNMSNIKMAVNSAQNLTKVHSQLCSLPVTNKKMKLHKERYKILANHANIVEAKWMCEEAGGITPEVRGPIDKGQLLEFMIRNKVERTAAGVSYPAAIQELLYDSDKKVADESRLLFPEVCIFDSNAEHRWKAYNWYYKSAHASDYYVWYERKDAQLGMCLDHNTYYHKTNGQFGVYKTFTVICEFNTTEEEDYSGQVFTDSCVQSNDYMNERLTDLLKTIPASFATNSYKNRPILTIDLERRRRRRAAKSRWREDGILSEDGNSIAHHWNNNSIHQKSPFRRDLPKLKEIGYLYQTAKVSYNAYKTYNQMKNHPQRSMKLVESEEMDLSSILDKINRLKDYQPESEDESTRPIRQAIESAVRITWASVELDNQETLTAVRQTESILLQIFNDLMDDIDSSIKAWKRITTGHQDGVSFPLIDQNELRAIHNKYLTENGIRTSIKPADIRVDTTLLDKDYDISTGTVSEIFKVSYKIPIMHLSTQAIIFEIIPWPKFQDGYQLMAIPEAKYIAIYVSHQKSKLLSPTEVAYCMKHTFCMGKQPTISEDVASCAAASYFRNDNQRCTMKRLNTTLPFFRAIREKVYFATPTDITAETTCTFAYLDKHNNFNDVVLSGYGSFETSPSCKLEFNDISMQPEIPTRLKSSGGGPVVRLSKYSVKFQENAPIALGTISQQKLEEMVSDASKYVLLLLILACVAICISLPCIKYTMYFIFPCCKRIPWSWRPWRTSRPDIDRQFLRRGEGGWSHEEQGENFCDLPVPAHQDFAEIDPILKPVGKQQQQESCDAQSRSVRKKELSNKKSRLNSANSTAKFPIILGVEVTSTIQKGEQERRTRHDGVAPTPYYPSRAEIPLTSWTAPPNLTPPPHITNIMPPSMRADTPPYQITPPVVDPKEALEHRLAVAFAAQSERNKKKEKGKQLETRGAHNDDKMGAEAAVPLPSQ